MNKGEYNNSSKVLLADINNSRNKTRRPFGQRKKDIFNL